MKLLKVAIYSESHRIAYDKLIRDYYHRQVKDQTITKAIVARLWMIDVLIPNNEEDIETFREKRPGEFLILHHYKYRAAKRILKQYGRILILLRFYRERTVDTNQSKRKYSAKGVACTSTL